MSKTNKKKKPRITSFIFYQWFFEGWTGGREMKTPVVECTLCNIVHCAAAVVAKPRLGGTRDVHVLVACLVQRSGVKLQPDDRKYDDGEQHQQADLEQRSHGLDDGLQHDLQTYTTKRRGKKQKNNVELHVSTADGNPLFLAIIIRLKLFRSTIRHRRRVARHPF